MCVCVCLLYSDHEEMTGTYLVKAAPLRMEGHEIMLFHHPNASFDAPKTAFTEITISPNVGMSFCCLNRVTESWGFNIGVVQDVPRRKDIVLAEQP